MKLVLILTLFMSSSVFSQSSCNLPAARFPVFDQDGLGTCASNTAAMMMRYNIEGMTEVPSYLQLAVGSMASGTDSFFQASSDPNPKRGRSQVLFFEGNHVCNVVNNGLEHGFCDSKNFALDFLGTEDAFQSQQKSLDSLGRLLSQNRNAVQQLRRELANPATRGDAVARLAEKIYQDGQVCNQEPRRVMALRMLERRRVAWSALQSRTTNPAERQMLQTLMSRSFRPNGQPTQEMIDFIYERMFPQGFETVLGRDEANDSREPDKISGIQYSESIIGVHWGYKLGFESPNFLGSTPSDINDIRNDWKIVGQCKGPSVVRALENYFKDPQCPVQGLPVPQSVTNNVEQIARELISSAYDPQNALISIISPACAYQARSRVVNNYNCNMTVTRNARDSAQARSTTINELCAGRAVGVSVCSGFLEASAPYFSNYCTNLRPGTPGNAYHAMTIISARQSGEKRQFLLQNSWGRTCKFANGAVLKPGFSGSVECELGRDGMPSGRFWIDEELLFNNTSSISVLKKG